MMKYLVMGCNGMAGHLISLYLKEQGHDVDGFARTRSDLIDNTIVGDAKDIDLVRQTVIGGRYDFIINCIGILNQFAEYDKSNAVLSTQLSHKVLGRKIPSQLRFSA